MKKKILFSILIISFFLLLFGIGGLDAAFVDPGNGDDGVDLCFGRGDYCSTDTDCCSGLYCWGNTCFYNGTVSTGGFCFNGVECVSGSCNNNICCATSGSVSLGGSCSCSEDCYPSFAVCDGGQCCSPEGGLCSTNIGCCPGTKCEPSAGYGPSLCRACSSQGASCSSDSDCCDADNECDNNICSDSSDGNGGGDDGIPLGGTCNSTQECNVPLECVGSTCSQYVARGENCTPASSLCSSPYTCRGGVCIDESLLLDGGQDCAGDAECSSNECSGGQCVFGITVINPLQNTILENITDKILDYIFYASMLLVPLLLIVAGYLFMTAVGDSQKIAQAKKLTLWTIIGFIVVLFSRGIMVIIK